MDSTTDLLEVVPQRTVAMIEAGREILGVAHSVREPPDEPAVLAPLPPYPAPPVGARHVAAKQGMTPYRATARSARTGSDARMPGNV